VKLNAMLTKNQIVPEYIGAAEQEHADEPGRADRR